MRVDSMTLFDEVDDLLSRIPVTGQKIPLLDENLPRI